jgi:NADPH2:quinone reductase
MSVADSSTGDNADRPSGTRSTTLMHAARCHRPGDSRSVVVVEEIERPVPGEGDAVVDVAAAAVNFPDTLIMNGAYQVSIPTPYTPGSEFAGIVSSIGPGVDTLTVGDRVMGSTFTGAFAEAVKVPAKVLSKVPDGVELRLAAGFPVAHGTGYHALRTLANTQAGDWVVVLGAAGGVGSATIGIARLLGARVVAAASSEEKLAMCRELGAEATVDYSIEPLKDRLKELTGGGADVVIDPVGGPYSEQALRAMRWGGRFICVGFASGEIPRIPLNLLLLKGVWATGFEKRTFPDHAPAAEARCRDELVAWLAAGDLQPRIGAAYPLEQVSQALADVAERRATGKIIIDINE